MEKMGTCYENQQQEKVFVCVMYAQVRLIRPQSAYVSDDVSQCPPPPILLFFLTYSYKLEIRGRTILP